MTCLEKMRRYIELTGVTYSDSTPYQMNIAEMMDLRALAEQAPMDALCLAFEYGRAKGVRATKNRATK
ncbi:hypothetical protein [uncultured Flavonifractor sp.]|uniref:hypothetical protein n=1 Tax=uncultured Flavonifractor sp. TaxID=1193534 RepID=UPI00261CED6E|nr:hypothetical protein [uncultured Flavonifractor sp.]